MKKAISFFLYWVAAFWLSGAGVLSAGLIINPYAFADASPVMLLLHCDGTDGSTSFPDSSLFNRTVTAHGNAQVDTAQFKFGTGSALLDGSGDYLTAPTGTPFQFTGDFTVEFWVRFATTGTQVLFDCRTGDTSTGFVIYADGLAWNVYSGALRINGVSGQATGTWYHVALCRSGSSIRLFIDGVQAGSTWTSSTSFTDGVCVIGAMSDGTSGANGWLDEIRIANGFAYYTSNFTPPSAPFPNP